MAKVYVGDWQTCGKFCANLIKPEKCNFWTLDINSESGSGYCELLNTDEGIHVADSKVSGNNQCPGT